tara:strand:+ start:95 stop:472 length:378 start_codon:yes stop_codon:yes gene_type:complete
MNKLKKDLEEILAKTENSKEFPIQKERIDRFKYLRNLISNFKFLRLKPFIILIISILLLTLLFGPFSNSSGYFLFVILIIVLGFLFFLNKFKKSNTGYEKKWRGKNIESDEKDTFITKFKNFFYK